MSNDRRVRLTERARRRRAVDDSIPYPGTVNQPERRFKKRDQYDNWEETVNHPYPDLRHEWKDNPRDEIGFGVPEAWGTQPTVASVKVAADKAVRVAILLLGEKTPDAVVEDQARDLITMGGEALDRTIARFSKTQKLYVAEDEAADEEEEMEEEEATTAADDSETEDEESMEEEEATTAADDSEDSDDSDDDDSDEDDSDDEDSGDEVTASDTGIVLEPLRGMNEMDIELQASTDSEFAPDAEADALLASIFDDGGVPAELPQAKPARKASAKKGVKSLGGQPKVASTGDNMADIGNIWSKLDAPDVSSVFN